MEKKKKREKKRKVKRKKRETKRKNNNKKVRTKAERKDGRTDRRDAQLSCTVTSLRKEGLKPGPTNNNNGFLFWNISPGNTKAHKHPSSSEESDKSRSRIDHISGLKPVILPDMSVVITKR